MEKKEIIAQINEQVTEETKLMNPVCINGVDFDYIDEFEGGTFLYSYDHDIEVDVDESLSLGVLTCVLEGI